MDFKKFVRTTAEVIRLKMDFKKIVRTTAGVIRLKMDFKKICKNDCRNHIPYNSVNEWTQPMNVNL
jgi:hypothetical protein